LVADDAFVGLFFFTYRAFIDPMVVLERITQRYFAPTFCTKEQGALLIPYVAHVDRE
jgi:hypothetical protein